MVPPMRTQAGIVLACLTIGAIGSPAVSACGDKFLLVGRGVSFRHAYAAIHPASILLVLPAKSVKSAAIRDSGLLSALKLAGHRVEVVQQPANLADVLGRSRHDIVLAERADASSAEEAAATVAQAKPSIVSVVEGASSAEAPASPGEYLLKAPQRLPQILNLLDDVMKVRRSSNAESRHRARKSRSPGAAARNPANFQGIPHDFAQAAAPVDQRLDDDDQMEWNGIEWNGWNGI